MTELLSKYKMIRALEDLIRAGNIFTLTLNRVYVFESTDHPVSTSRVFCSTRPAQITRLFPKTESFGGNKNSKTREIGNTQTLGAFKV